MSDIKEKDMERERFEKWWQDNNWAATSDPGDQMIAEEAYSAGLRAGAEWMRESAALLLEDGKSWHSREDRSLADQVRALPLEEEEEHG